MKINRELFRAKSADGLSLDKEARTIEFPFSSEYAVERWFGKEVLSHSPSAMELDRLNDGGALLWNHQGDTVIGVVERAELRQDKRIWAKARFSKNAKAEEIMRDIEDGILKNVSFGYQIKEMTRTNPAAKDQGPEFLATKWMPFEVSIVSIPADPTVGIGRSQSDDEVEVRITNLGEKREMSVTEKTVTEKPAVDTAALRAEAMQAERARISAITALGDKFGQADLARQLVESGRSIEEARAAVLEKIGSEKKPVSESAGAVGLSAKEVRQFSFMNAIRAMMNPENRQFQELAKFEREVSIAAEKVAGKAARGFMIPVDVLRSSQRDLTVGTAADGGNLVGTSLLAQSFIDLLRKKSVLQRAGAGMLNGLVGNIAIPRQSGAATAYWVAESGAPTESKQAFDQVSMSPKTVGAFTDYSRKLMLQSSIDIEAMIRMDLATVIALEIDRAGLYGSGASNQPTGVKNVTGINTKDFDAAAPTFAEIVELETLVAADDADIGALKYLVNATGRGALKTAEKAEGTAQFIWEAGNTVNGYGAEVSNQIASGDYWFGNWADVIMGFWSGLDLTVDPYTGSSSGTVRVVALQDTDIVVRHPESFCRGNNTL
jgi:HK97 family phage major capsid protein/HK97 family phage prohead protease